MAEKYADQMAQMIIEMMKKGAADWRKDWKASLGYAPVNGVTLKKYRGSNWLRLLLQMWRHGWGDARFFTLKQVETYGGRVKAGAQPTTVRYCNCGMSYGDSDYNGFVVRYSEVYNAVQCEGVPEPPVVYKQNWEDYDNAERIIRNSNIRVFYDQSDAQYYDWCKDEVHLTPRGNFPTAAGFYATALHELAHATGHKSRLNRKIQNRFGSKDYAQEELRAEIASMMMCSKLGIEIGEMDPNHIAYLNDWCRILEHTPSEIVKACNAAERICKWLFEQVKDEKGITLYENLSVLKRKPRHWMANKEYTGPIILTVECRPMEEIIKERERINTHPSQAELRERLLRMRLRPDEIKERVRLLAEGKATLGVDHRQ